VTWTTELRVLADEIFQDTSNHLTCYRTVGISFGNFIIITGNFLVKNEHKLESVSEEETQSVTTGSMTMHENEPGSKLPDDDDKSESETAYEGIEQGDKNK